MTLLSYSQDSTQIDLTPTVYSINEDTNFCFTSDQSKEILILMQERNTYKNLFEIMEESDRKCNSIVHYKDNLITQYQEDSVIYETQKLKLDSILTNKDEEIEDKNERISTLKTHRGMLGISTIILIILAIL